MVVTLGDDESRQRRKVWRQALLQRAHFLVNSCRIDVDGQGNDGGGKEEERAGIGDRNDMISRNKQNTNQLGNGGLSIAIRQGLPLKPASAVAPAISVEGSKLRRGWDACADHTADHTGPEGREVFRPYKPEAQCLKSSKAGHSVARPSVIVCGPVNWEAVATGTITGNVADGKAIHEEHKETRGDAGVLLTDAGRRSKTSTGTARDPRLGCFSDKMRPKGTTDHATITRIERQVGDDHSAEDGLRVSPGHKNAAPAHERDDVGKPCDGNDQQPHAASVAKRINEEATCDSDGIVDRVLANNNEVLPRRVLETVANATLLKGNASHAQKRVPVMPRRVDVRAAEATPTLALATMNNGLRVSREALVDEAVKKVATRKRVERCRSADSVKAKVGLTPRAGEDEIPHRSGDCLTTTGATAILLGMDMAETAQLVDGEGSIGASSTMQTATKRSGCGSGSASPVGWRPEQGETPENNSLDIDGSVSGISANIQVATTARSGKRRKESRSTRKSGNPPLLPDRERSSARKGRSCPSASPAGSREQSEIEVPCAEEPLDAARNDVICREHNVRRLESRISERLCLSSYARNKADLGGKETTDGSGTLSPLSQGVEDAEGMRCSGDDENRTSPALTLDGAPHLDPPDRSESVMTKVAAASIEQCRRQYSRRDVLSSPGSARKVGSDPTVCHVGNGEDICIGRIEEVLPLASPVRPMLDDGGLHVSRPPTNPTGSGSRVPLLSTASVYGGSGPSASERFVRCTTDQEAAGGVLGALVAGLASVAADLHGAPSSLGPSDHATPSATLDAMRNGDSAVGALPLSSRRLADPPSAGNASSSFLEHEFQHQQGSAAGAAVHSAALVIEAAVAVENLLATDRHQSEGPRVSIPSSGQAETRQMIRHGRKGMPSSPSSGASARTASSTDSQFFAKDSGPQEPADYRQNCSRGPRSAGNVRLPSSRSSKRLNSRRDGRSSTRFRSSVQMLESELSSLSWPQRRSDRIGSTGFSDQLSGSSGGERQRDGSGTPPGASPPLATTPLSPSSVSALTVTLLTANSKTNGFAEGVQRSRPQLFSCATAAPLIATRTPAGSGGDLARVGSREASPNQGVAGIEEAAGLMTSPGAATPRICDDNRPSIDGGVPLVDEPVVIGAKCRSAAFADKVRPDSTMKGGNESQANRSNGSEVAGDSGDGERRLQVQSGESTCSSNEKAESESWLIASSPVEKAAGSRSSTGSSGRRGEVTLLRERLSEAFLRRRLQRLGLR